MGGGLKLRGLAVGLVGNAAIALALFHLIQTGSCGGSGAPPCPAGVVPWVAALPIGILVSIAGMFMGGGPVIFAGVFLAVGLGAMGAAAFGNLKEMESFAWWFGGMFAFFGVAPLLIGLALKPVAAARQAKAMRLIASGRQGVGTVTDVRDTGVTINRNPHVEIVMRVEPAEGGPAIERRKTVTVSRVSIPRVGERYPVWYDPADPESWAFGVDMEANAPPEIQAAFARARAAPAAEAEEAEETNDRPPTPLEELERLNGLRLSGAVTAREFETAKAQLLARLANG